MDLAVELGLDLARQEEVRLLERVVVLLGRAAELVVDREHRQQVGAEDPVDEHLHRDPAVGEQRGVHAGRLAAAGRIVDARAPRPGAACRRSGRRGGRPGRRTAGARRCATRAAASNSPRVKNVSLRPASGRQRACGVFTDSQRTWLVAGVRERMPGPDRASGRSRRRRGGGRRRRCSSSELARRGRTAPPRTSGRGAAASRPARARRPRAPCGRRPGPGPTSTSPGEAAARWRRRRRAGPRTTSRSRPT